MDLRPNLGGIRFNPSPGCQFPLPSGFPWRLIFLWLNQVNGIFELSQRLDQIFAGENFPHVAACTRVVNDRIAIPGETDTNDQMATVTAGSATKPVVAN